MKKASAFVLSALLAAPDLGAWGNYGHQQINVAALKLLPPGPLRDWLVRSTPAVQRLAITPDYDWKMIGRAPADPELKKKKLAVDRQEHPLHYFECDAFDPKCPADLPAGDYPDVFPKYREKLAARTHVAEPTRFAVMKHGTAPWRALQLHRLAVAAMKKGDFHTALLALGTMGHYMGDLSQPFHTTLNFDGALSEDPAAGIHHTFEGAILDGAARKKKAKRDPVTYLWNGFQATEAAVLAAARAHAAADMSSAKLVASLLGLVSSGYPSVAPLLDAFAAECAKATLASPDQPHCLPPPPEDRHAHVRVGVRLEDAFAIRRVRDSEKHSVMELAAIRMGASAKMLARAWETAYAEAGSPGLPSRATSFDSLNVIDRYPAPSYLP